MRNYGARERLIKAFFHFLENQHYTCISVTDLITEANVSRTTFYRYFDDVLDMYDKICQDMIEKLIAEIACAFIYEKPCIPDLFDTFCEKLESQKEYIALLCGKNGGRRFFEIGLAVLSAYIEENNIKLTKLEKSAFQFTVFSGIGTYVKSLIDGVEYNTKYLELYRKILTEAQKAGAIDE